MNLPIFKQLTHISPSTFIEWRKCQYKNYLRKFSGIDLPRTDSGKSAALGIMFDAFVKDNIYRRFNYPHKPSMKLEIVAKNLKCEDKDEVIKDAREVAKQYISIGMLERMLPDKIDQELYKIKDGIPLLGILDGIVNNIPFDWKTRGFYSKWPASPTPGYFYRIDSNRHEPTPGEFINLDRSHYDWAIQFQFYNWILGNQYPQYILHEICKQKKDLVFTEHKGTLSKEFEDDLWKEVQEFWGKINGFDIKVNEPSPNKNLCEAYGQLCEVAVYCKRYQDTLGSNDREKYL